MLIISMRKIKLTVIFLAVNLLLSCGGGSSSNMDTSENLVDSPPSTPEPPSNGGSLIDLPTEGENQSGEQENNQTSPGIISDFVQLKKVEIEVNVDENSLIAIQAYQQDSKQIGEVYKRDVFSLEFSPCPKSSEKLNTYICTVYLKEDFTQEIPVIVTYKFKLFNLVYVSANQDKIQTTLDENTTETLKEQGIIKAIKVTPPETSTPISTPAIPNTEQTEQYGVIYVINTYKLNPENNSDNFIYEEEQEAEQYNICIF